LPVVFCCCRKFSKSKQASTYILPLMKSVAPASPWVLSLLPTLVNQAMVLQPQGFSPALTRFTTCVVLQHPKGKEDVHELCLISAMTLLLGPLLRALVLAPAPRKLPRDSDITALGVAPTTLQTLLLVDVDRHLIVPVVTRQALPQSLLFTVERAAQMIHSCLRRKAPHVGVKNPQIGANLRARRV
jgi:hypothetical protein